MRAPILLMFGLALALPVSAQGQSSPPPSASKFMMQGQAEQSSSSIIRDALGKPCLDLEAAARPQVVNPDMIDHVVSIKNNCPRTIRVKACYYGSDRCNEVTVSGYKRVDTILGTMRSVNFFRYSIHQK